MNKKKIILTVVTGLLIVASFAAWKMFNKKTSHSGYSGGLFSDDINYVSNTNSSADRFISTMKEELMQNPDNVKVMTSLAAAYIQKARESNDPQFYSLSEKILNRALEIEPENFLALAELGSVKLSRHEFAEALELSQKAVNINPYSSYSYGVMTDAQVELGKYEDAIATLQKMINIKPDLGSYSRVSYLRELHGDIEGAIDAMKMAVNAGSPGLENTAWCRVQLGNLYYNKGEIDTASMIFNSVVSDFSNYAHGYGSLAKISLLNGDYNKAIELFSEALQKNSLPEYLIALGDAYTLNGEMDKAEEQYRKVKFAITLFKQEGVDTDLELALFNADHNRELKESLKDAESSLEDGSQSIKTYHVLAWTNYKLGNYEEAAASMEQALRTGTKDPLMLYHASKIFEMSGNTEKAKVLASSNLTTNKFYEKLYSVDQHE